MNLEVPLEEMIPRSATPHGSVGTELRLARVSVMHSTERSNSSIVRRHSDRFASKWLRERWWLMVPTLNFLSSIFARRQGTGFPNQISSLGGGGGGGGGGAGASLSELELGADSTSSSDVMRSSSSREDRSECVGLGAGSETHQVQDRLAVSAPPAPAPCACEKHRA